MLAAEFGRNHAVKEAAKDDGLRYESAALRRSPQ
jgi:hypothetical protein